MGFMENLDIGVLENILFRLPRGATSSQAKRVCKSWKSILDDRRRYEMVGYLFAFPNRKATYENNKFYECNKIQLYCGEEYDHIDIINKMINYDNYSPETLMEMEHCRFVSKIDDDNILVGSCNGLVCLQKQDPRTHRDEPFSICNPLTGEFIFLRDNLNRALDSFSPVSSGFGYCQSTDEYKVVRLHTHHNGTQVQVYTIGTNKWRDIETYMKCKFFADGIFANGVVNWLNYDKDTIRIRNVVAFGMEDEKFREIPLPPRDTYKEGYDFSELKLLGGNLCLVNSYRTGVVDIWVYKRMNLNTNIRYGMEVYDQKNDYYSTSSWNWVKHLSIECGGHDSYKLLSITKDNRVLMSCRRFMSYCYESYDPITRTISKLGDYDGVGRPRIQAIPHVNSYISLKDSGETWYGPESSQVPSSGKPRLCIDRSYKPRRSVGRTFSNFGKLCRWLTEDIPIVFLSVLFCCFFCFFYFVIGKIV